MANGTTTYSFKDLTGAIASPLAGPFVLTGGYLGAGKITVNMANEWTEHNRANDAAIMVSVSPGDDGDIEIQCQQTSAINAYLKSAQNLHQTAVRNGDSSNWAAIMLDLQNPVTGDKNTCTGVSFTKKPSLPFGSKGEMISWKLMSANIDNQ
jgi:hypothetical protein